MNPFNCCNSDHSLPENHFLHVPMHSQKNDSDLNARYIENVKIDDLSSMVKLAHYVMVNKENIFNHAPSLEILEKKLRERSGELANQIKPIRAPSTWIGSLFSLIFSRSLNALSDKNKESDYIERLSSCIEEIKQAKAAIESQKNRSGKNEFPKDINKAPQFAKNSDIHHPVNGDEDENEFPDNPEIFSLEEDPFFADQPTQVSSIADDALFSGGLIKSQNDATPLVRRDVTKVNNIEKSAMIIQKMFRNFSMRKKTVEKQEGVRNAFQAILKREPTLISSEQLNEVLFEMRDKTEKIDLANILKERGFLPEIKGHAFISDLPLRNMNVEGITFSDCKFDWTSCSDSSLKKVKFKDCEIKNLSLMNAKIEDCLFERCDLQEVMFTGAGLERVCFLNTTLHGCSFEDTDVNNCEFKEVVMTSTHFFDAKIKRTAISASDLKDTLFFGNFHHFTIDNPSKKTARVTKPTTAILVDPENRGETTPKANKKLNQNAHTIAVRITMKVQTATKDRVNQEVQLALSDKEVGSFKKGESPIPQRLIVRLAESQDSDCAKILKKAESLANQVDSIFLPGGEDIPPSLYGAPFSKRTNCGDDYRRSILEIALIHQSFTKGIPLMAVCRGFQMSHIYFGAQLIQDIKGHNGVYQEFKLNSSEAGFDFKNRHVKSSLYSEVFDKSKNNNIISVCCHHQIVDPRSEATQYLQTSIRYEGYTKASELKNSGATPMILLQFHPEFYKGGDPDDKAQMNIDHSMSNENEIFWKILRDSAQAHRIKQMTLQSLKSLPTHNSKKQQKMGAKIYRASRLEGNLFKFFQKISFPSVKSVASL